MNSSLHWGQRSLIALSLLLVFTFLVLPLLLIMSQAFSQGLSLFLAAIQSKDMLHAIGLSLVVALLSVPINALFGLLLAWCVTHYRFKGRQLLITLINIPYATSPVVAGLCYLVVYGAESHFGHWLDQHGIQLMFAWPGLVMVTLFVTSPFVARLLIPLMQSQGSEQEQAALTLGANGWQIFSKITLPKIKWALLYGIVLSNARAIGEFGAVSVVSGAIRGKTLTLPLLVEQLHDDHKVVGAFSAALLLASIALFSLIVKSFLERKATN